MANVQHDISNYGNLNPGVSTTESSEEEEKYDSNDILINPSQDPLESKETTKKGNTSQSKVEDKESSKEEKPTYGTGAKETESVLSFNFLYYIIQKFKFTDIGEQ